MAKNGVNTSLDFSSRKYNKRKLKRGQNSNNQDLKAKRSFKLKRRRQNDVQNGLNNQNKKRRNTGFLKTKYLGQENQNKNRKQQFERQKVTIKSGGVKQNKLNLISRINMTKKTKRHNANTSSNYSRPIPGKNPSNSTVTGDKEAPKLFTKNFDARKRIEARKQAKERRKQGSVQDSSKVELDLSRRKQRHATVNQRRELYMTEGNMKITSRIGLEENRHTLVTGNSLQVTALRTDTERYQDREAVMKSNNAISITAGNKEEEGNHDQPSEYSLFEARRKALKTVNISLPEQSIPALPAVSKPGRSAPILEPEEDDHAQAGSTKILVTNLHPNVSQDDIYELFGSLAPLKSWRLLRTGAAEVVYKNYDDAVLAYGKYHGRNLDGQPMICKIVAPEKQIYMPPTTRLPPQDTKVNSTKQTTRPVVFTVKI